MNRRHLLALIVFAMIALPGCGGNDGPAPGSYEARLKAALAECEQAEYGQVGIPDEYNDPNANPDKVAKFNAAEDRVTACVDVAMGTAPK